MTEVMVTMILMVVVLFALYSIFDMSIRVFSFGNDKVEATENARIGLARMEREVRAAYPYDKVVGSPSGDKLLAVWGASEIRFGNDFLNGGNRKVDECLSAGTPCEEISYRTYQKPDGTYALGRTNSYAGTPQPVVEFVDYVSSSDTGVQFSYLRWDSGANDFVAAANEDEIDLVRISLRVRVDETTQTLSTDVDLRNRGA